MAFVLEQSFSVRRRSKRAAVPPKSSSMKIQLGIKVEY